ncbi:CWF19-like protein 1 [Euwallacea similis]|uniref:CWF19-like protein 1 n=1 Tax=Euwallacea similis TaxID=1736056 RepID=UPI0034504E69
MAEKIKILLCGDVEGRFNALFKRVSSINDKSGPFDLLLCVGNFFGINNKEFGPYKLGEKKVPIPTYILGPNAEHQFKEYPQDEAQFELCTHVYYLGKRGIYNDSKGLKIAYLSGLSSDQSSLYSCTEQDVLELCDAALKGNASFRGIDILLTSQWPQKIVHDGKEVNLTGNSQSELVSYLCMKLKPRYVVSGLEGVYYERPPFRCPNLGEHDTTMETVTRFIGLARVGNPKKDKWIYALNVTPMDKMKIADLVQKTTDETPCPFNFQELEDKIFRKKKRKSEGPRQYFYDMTTPSDQEERRNNKKRPRIEFDQSKCWFCLSSPSVEKHLVVTVGESCYLALAKGGMVEEHFLICPMEHFQSSLSCTEEVLQEMQKFKQALHKFYHRNGQVPVFFERNYKTSHMQLQTVPIPKKATKELKDIFIDEAEVQGFQLEALESYSRLDQVVPQKTPFFMVELPDGQVLYTKIQASMNFPLSFGREVLASGPVLDMLDRVEYKECLLEKSKEEEVVARIRTDFEPFDFTM